MDPQFSKKMIVLTFFNGQSIQVFIVEHSYDLDLACSRSIVCENHYVLNGQDWQKIKQSYGNLQAQLAVLNECLEVDVLEFILQTSKQHYVTYNE